MQTYFVRRRGFAADATELQAALSRLQAVEQAACSASVRWLHSYALAEAVGRFGLACVLRADNLDSLHHHAEFAALPATEILPVAATVLLRPIPVRSVYLLRCRDGQTGVRAWHDDQTELNEHTHCLRAYVTHEDNGVSDSICLYQSPLQTTLANHVARSGTAIVDVTPVIGRIVYRDET